MTPPPRSRLSNVLSLPLVLTLGLLSAACGGEVCDTGSEQHRTEMFFGLDRENGVPVSETEWQAFVDDTVTPRFKSGLTMFDANGQYLMDNGTLVHENSKVIVLLHDGSSARQNDIDAIREEYKRRFNQESVLSIESISCVTLL